MLFKQILIVCRMHSRSTPLLNHVVKYNAHDSQSKNGEIIYPVLSGGSTDQTNISWNKNENSHHHAVISSSERNEIRYNDWCPPLVASGGGHFKCHCSRRTEL